jgi:hypothetical protein
MERPRPAGLPRGVELDLQELARARVEPRRVTPIGHCPATAGSIEPGVGGRAFEVECGLRAGLGLVQPLGIQAIFDGGTLREQRRRGSGKAEGQELRADSFHGRHIYVTPA